MQIARWGNSLAVRIPADVVRELGLREGDDIELCALETGQVAIISEKQRREAALASIRRMARPLPERYKFDREEATAR